MLDQQQLKNILVPFYRGEQADIEGRMIQDIWAWDLSKLEYTHNYIQWLFPLTEASAFNRQAPLVDSGIIQDFCSDRLLHENLIKSLMVMLNFYGLQLQENESGPLITKSANYSQRQQWLNPYNHNYLRITRILKSLKLLGCSSYAQSYYQCLAQIYAEANQLIGAETFKYWTNAARF